MKDHLLYFGNRRTSFSHNGVLFLTEDGFLSFSYRTAGESFTKKLKLPCGAETVRHIVVREDLLYILVCYDDKVVEVDGESLFPVLFEQNTESDEITLPWGSENEIMYRTHTTPILGPITSCCFPPSQRSVYFVMDSHYMLYSYSTQKHTDLPLVQFSLRDVLSNTLGAAVTSAVPSGFLLLPSAGDAVTIVILLSTGLFVAVKNVPSRHLFLTEVTDAPFCPCIQEEDVEISLSGSSIPDEGMSPLFFQEYGFLNAVICSIYHEEGETVYCVASPRHVVITLFSSSLCHFSTLATHDVTALHLSNPCFAFNTVRMELVLEEEERRRAIDLRWVRKVLRREPVWGASTVSPVTPMKKAESVSGAMLCALLGEANAIYFQELARNEVQCIEALYDEMDKTLGMSVVGDSSRVDRVLASLDPSCVFWKQRVKND